MRFSSTFGRVLMAVLATTALCAGLAVSAEAAPATTPTAPAGIRTAIHPGLHGFDSLNVETPAQIHCLHGGYAFDMVNTNDTTNAEYNAAAADGMTVVLFQGYYQPYWKASAYGTSQGQKAALAAVKMKYPAGATIFLNLEATTNSNATIMQWWVTHWVAAVRASHFLAGVYVGANPGLSAAVLNKIPGLNVFWRSTSASAPQMTRGYVLRQTAVNSRVCTTLIDGDVVGNDVNHDALVGAAFAKAH